jgi:diapolycopene oxygenase
VRNGKIHIIVIGAGLGGMAAAISLATSGYSVEIYEKNDRVGGKLNIFSRDGFTFDLGPSILTLPQVFESLFAKAGKRFNEYVPIRELHLHWRNFFENGTVIDLVKDPEKQKRNLTLLDPKAPSQFDRFMKYCKNQYDIIDRTYLSKGADSLMDMARSFSITDIARLDLLHTMHKRIGKFFKNDALHEIFDFFVKYVGSSAYNAPGFMNLLPWVQYAYGLWYVEGGMYNCARGMQRLLDELSVPLHFGREVVTITTDENKRKVNGVVLSDGTHSAADIVVSNMEVIPAYRSLLSVSPEMLSLFNRFEPACSGIVLHLGLDTIYPQLAHHNFFYSKDQSEHFRALFDNYRLPDDPTLYVVAPTRTDPSQAPKGYDNLKILAHIPYIRSRNGYAEEDYQKYKNVLIEKCEQIGLKELRKHIVIEDFWTPYDIANRYYSNCGAIYGIVSDRSKNFAFKAPKRSDFYHNLFFTGGSVNPGGGMPMVTMSGMHVGTMIAQRYPPYS